MIRQLNLQEVRKYMLQDTVRGRLGAEFRLKAGREVWALFEDRYAEHDEPDLEPLAVICVAYTKGAPQHEMELEFYADPDGDHAVFYTVWSYQKGAGTRLVNAVAQRILEDRPHTRRWITLSPKTLMAERFHIKNGAKFVKKFISDQIFEYTHLMRKDPTDA
jgi:hypothetical protein